MPDTLDLGNLAGVFGLFLLECNGTYGQVWQDWPGRDLEDDETVIAPTFADFSTELLRRLTTRSVAVDDDRRLSFERAGNCWVV